jgi:hypothetical protein
MNRHVALTDEQPINPAARACLPVGDRTGMWCDEAMIERHSRLMALTPDVFLIYSQ